jgi:hypothetical protein
MKIKQLNEAARIHLMDENIKPERGLIYGI